MAGVYDVDDMDVFDAMRWLLEAGVDLDDKSAVERALYRPGSYYENPMLWQRFVRWSITAACANVAAGGLQRHGLATCGLVPPEPDAVGEILGRKP